MANTLGRVLHLLRSERPTVAFARDYLFRQQVGVASHALLYLFPFLGAVLALTGLLLGDQRRQVAARDTLPRLFPARDWQVEIRALLAAGDRAELLGPLSGVALFWLGSSFVASLARLQRLLWHPPALRGRAAAGGAGGDGAPRGGAPRGARGVGSRDAHPGCAGGLPATGVATVLAWGQRLVVGLTVAIAALLTTFLLLLLSYWLLPNVRQSPLAVRPGAALAAVLTTLMVQLFPLYLRLAPVGRYGDFFGLALLFTLWLYLLAHILLFGAALNAFRHRAGRR